MKYFILNIQHNVIIFCRQEAFLENFIASQRENIFRSVEVLIYVFDVECRDEDLKKDIKYFQSCLSAISENSPNAKVFCLVHKMDLIQEDQKEKVLHVFKFKFFFFSLRNRQNKIYLQVVC